MNYKELGIEPFNGTKVSQKIETVYAYNGQSKSKIPDMPDLLHFYTEDWRWTKIIKSSKYAIEYSKNFKYVVMPDYSVYYDSPVVDQLYKIAVAYRLSNKLQRAGIKVIRNVFLTSEDIFDINIYGESGNDYCVQFQTKTDDNRLAKEIELCNNLPNNLYVYCADRTFEKLRDKGLKTAIHLNNILVKLRKL